MGTSLKKVLMILKVKGRQRIRIKIQTVKRKKSRKQENL